MRARAAPDQPEAERQRISSELAAIQRDLNVYIAWTRLECAEIGAVYKALIDEMRRVVGAEISRAWELPPASADREMQIPGLDLSALDAPAEEYLQAVASRL